MSHQKSPLPGSPVQPEPLNQSAEPSCSNDRPQRKRGRTVEHGGEVEKDAPPSNTASDKCNSGLFVPLRWGVDSLYLSFPGTLADSADKKLSELKRIAQSLQPHEQVEAQYSLGDHLFEVKDKGAGMFPFVLQDNCFRIALSRPAAKSLPLAYVQISSHFLNAAKPHLAESILRQLLDQLGDVDPVTNVSRIDLYIDFISDVDMESWSREAWVTRAHTINSYSVKGRFSGWAIGLGGIMAARLYDKTLELENSGKDYLKDLWAKAGWKEGQKVWRLEFEIKRELLTQKGIPSLPEVLNHLGSLWAYATDEWLRLTLPSAEDGTRSRWPVHPLWQCLSSVDWGGDSGPLLRRFTMTRVPDDAYILGRSLGLLFSYMAKTGLKDFRVGAELLMQRLQDYGEHLMEREGVPFSQYVKEQVAIRSRKYNIVFSPDEEPEDNIEQEAMARLYRKQARGE